MSKNIPQNDIRTLGFVLRRTNYGEADRILNIITPEGKMTVIAKGARKPKSKLAGGIEMFSLIDFNIYKGKSEFGIITGVKMLKYYSEILKDYKKMELMGVIMKNISRASESSDDEGYYSIVKQGMTALDEGMSVELVEGWFWLNYLKMIGEETNLYRDVNGEKLKEADRYNWDISQSAFFVKENGEYGSDEIKMMRLMVTNELKVIKQIKVDGELIGRVLGFARIVAGM